MIIINSILDKNHGSLLPIDSEHSALRQCLEGSVADEVEKLGRKCLLVKANVANGDDVKEMFAEITREGSRPLNEKEVIRVLKANLCIVCHDKGKDKDNIYGKTIDYRALDDRVHRRLLGGR